ncbi:MAG: hypothetical protein Q4P28_03860 [Tissierellia bacterium]|nr:hypothetical protein [Tissierellia bacterium]
MGFRDDEKEIYKGYSLYNQGMRNYSHCRSPGERKNDILPFTWLILGYRRRSNQHRPWSCRRIYFGKFNGHIA